MSGAAATERIRIGVVTFPGSNCDHDCYRVLRNDSAAEPVFLWHKSHDLQDVDAVILPGGFSYGDYLRAGAIARMSPLMREVRGFAEAGGLVLGICNGFQILCEAGLLPGALIRNRKLKFVSRAVWLRVERSAAPWTAGYEAGQILQLPIAHGEGCYVADEATLDELEAEGRILFRYSDRHGRADPAANPNGSARNIAGIINAAGNVLGMMPHPERAADPLLGSTDGAALFRSLTRSLIAA